MTQQQLELADVVDEMTVGQTIEIVSGDYITRVTECSYLLNDEKLRYGFIDLLDKLYLQVA